MSTLGILGYLPEYENLGILGYLPEYEYSGDISGYLPE